jgi:hypothetical protein
VVREVDVQPSYLGSSPHGQECGFLLFIKIKPAVGASPTAFLTKNILNLLIELIFGAHI